MSLWHTELQHGLLAHRNPSCKKQWPTCNWRHSTEARQRHHHHTTARNKVSLNNNIQLEPCVSAIICGRNLKWQTGRTGTQDTTGNCKSTRNTHTCWSHSHHVYCTVQTPQMQHHLHLTCSIQTCSYSEWQCCPSCNGTQRRLPGHLHF